LAQKRAAWGSTNASLLFNIGRIGMSGWKIVCWQWYWAAFLAQWVKQKGCFKASTFIACITYVHVNVVHTSQQALSIRGLIALLNCMTLISNKISISTWHLQHDTCRLVVWWWQQRVRPAMMTEP
jgi:hypothetical protein